MPASTVPATPAQVGAAGGAPSTSATGNVAGPDHTLLSFMQFQFVRRAFSTGNLHHVANDQKHLILADGKLFVFGIDPNEKAMVKCDVCCNSTTHDWHCK